MHDSINRTRIHTQQARISINIINQSTYPEIDNSNVIHENTSALSLSLSNKLVLLFSLEFLLHSDQSKFKTSPGLWRKSFYVIMAFSKSVSHGRIKTEAPPFKLTIILF